MFVLHSVFTNKLATSLNAHSPSESKRSKENHQRHLHDFGKWSSACNDRMHCVSCFVSSNLVFVTFVQFFVNKCQNNWQLNLCLNSCVFFVWFSRISISANLFASPMMRFQMNCSVCAFAVAYTALPMHLELTK